MRRFLAPFTAPELLVHTRSLADFITTTSEFRFSVHTAIKRADYRIAACTNMTVRLPSSCGLLHGLNETLFTLLPLGPASG